MTHSFPTRRSSDLSRHRMRRFQTIDRLPPSGTPPGDAYLDALVLEADTPIPLPPGVDLESATLVSRPNAVRVVFHGGAFWITNLASQRSEEHTSELQSLMRNSYAVFLLKKN